LWKDLTAAVFDISIQANYNNNVNNNDATNGAPQDAVVARGRPKVARVHSASFIPDSSDDEEGKMLMLRMEKHRSYWLWKN
jgi:hypothetical protein